MSLDGLEGGQVGNTEEACFVPTPSLCLSCHVLGICKKQNHPTSPQVKIKPAVILYRLCIWTAGCQRHIGILWKFSSFYVLQSSRLFTLCLNDVWRHIFLRITPSSSKFRTKFFLHLDVKIWLEMWLLNIFQFHYFLWRKKKSVLNRPR